MTTATLPAHVSFTHSNSFQDFCDLFKPNEQDKKFTTILFTLFALYFIVAVIVPFIEQVEVTREVKEQLPVQLAKIVLKEKQLPIPEKIIEKTVEKDIETPKEKPLEKPEEPLKEKIIEQPKTPQPVLSVEKRRELAKKTAQSSGLAAMKDELFAMREAFEVTPATQSTLTKEQSSEVKIKRELLAVEANKQGTSLAAANTINVVQSDTISTRNTQHIRLSDEEELANTDVQVDGSAKNKENSATTSTAQRSEVSLRKTLETHKARLYARYNSALRKDPFLQGKVLFEIEIQANGEISNIEIKSSELKNPKLERQLLVILRSIAFPAENVGVVKTIWAIDFLPS